MKATDRRGITRRVLHERNRGLEVPSVRSLPPKHRLLPERSAGGLVGNRTKAGVKEMQTRRTNLNHHHQERFVNTTRERSGPEAELIALAHSKGQLLAEHTLRFIRDTLELRGVTLDDFVADVRPHFRNNILNPSGFLIDRARRFHQLSRPASIPGPCTSVQTASTVCGACKGQKFLLTEKEIKPCPECSTAEFRRNWEAKEAARGNRVASEKASRLKAASEGPETF